MDITDNNLAFLDTLINMQGNKIYLNIYAKSIDSKLFIPFNSNLLKPSLKNFSFCVA